MVTRLEYGAQGVNLQFIVSHLLVSHYSDYSAQALYDGLYRQRDECAARPRCALSPHSAVPGAL